jgi:hypothetical protein
MWLIPKGVAGKVLFFFKDSISPVSVYCLRYGGISVRLFELGQSSLAVDIR